MAEGRDAYIRRMLEERPRLRARTCRCGQTIYAEDDFDFCAALNHNEPEV